MHTRIDCLIVAHIASGIPVPFGEFEDALEDHELIPVTIRGELIGAITKKENELHVAVLPEAEGLWFQKWVLRDVINPTIKRYGEVKTTVRKSNIKGQSFVERIGFEQTGETEEAYRYVLAKIRRA